MMKKVILSTAILFLIVGFSSCKKKCEVCTKENSPEVRICEDDYDSNTEYGLVLDITEASGYNCN
jgi:hypothetical protein